MAGLNMAEMMRASFAEVLEEVDSLAYRRGLVTAKHAVMSGSCTEAVPNDCACETAAQYRQLVADGFKLQSELVRRFNLR